MSSTTHPNVKVIEGMTAAAVNGDKDALAKIFTDRKSTRLNSSHLARSRMPSSA